MKRAQSKVNFPEERVPISREAREDQLIELAERLVEQRLRDGTASSQETVHYLRMGSRKERLEREIMEKQKELISAKTESLQASRKMEELFDRAMDALSNYRSSDRTEVE